MKLMWALLLHLGMNMWSDRPENGHRDHLVFDKTAWDEAVDYAAKSGVNAIFIDIGDAIQYRSHPEIAVKGAWEISQMKAEIQRLKEMGIALYPKLNFATTHDAWLGEYSRLVSTKAYYQVCKDLIHEVIEIFDTPDYFHLGMDEEWLSCPHFDFDCARYGKLYWHDLNYLLDCVRGKGVRPWIWADPYWKFPEEFIREVGTDVVVNPWYYDNLYGEIIDTYTTTPMMKNSLTELPKAGYMTIPCSSNWLKADHIDQMVRYVQENADESKLLGFMMAPWIETTEDCKYTILESIQLFKKAKLKYYG